MSKLRIYDMVINAEDETGVDINSFVDAPAHMRSFATFNKNRATFAVDAEKRVVTGVFIMADFLIYRNDRQLGEHFVKFSPDTIWQIRNKFFKNGFGNSTNVQHDIMVKGATLVDSYIVHSNDARFPQVPEILAGQKVNDGSWVGSYFIENEQLWQDCKNGIFKGFSVEGYFDKVETNIKTNMNKKNDKKKSLWKNIFGAESTEETMAEATTVDGVVIFYDGDLAVGTQVQIEVDGAKVNAPEGAHQVDIDGVTYAITLDAEGVVTDVQEVTALSEEATVIAEAMAKIVADAKITFEAQNKRIEDLEAQLKVIQSGGKFSSDPKKSGSNGDGKKSWRDLK